MSRPLNVLFLMIALPDMGRNTNMYADLIGEFSRCGHNVYPVAPVQEGGPKGLINENGIKVLRVETLPLFNIDPIRKGIANVLLPFQFRRAIRRYYPHVKFDLVITPTPPITFVDVAGWIKRRCNASVYLILRDIFPQNALDLCLMSRWNPMWLYFRIKERRLYSVADSIGCMSQGNIDYVLAHNGRVDGRKLHILENFQALEPIVEPDVSLRRKYGIEGKFVAIFGGNMGVPQRLENVLELARRCAEWKDVVFLMVGKGTERERIMRSAEQMGLTNMIFKEHVPHAEYQRLVAQCQIGLISLSERFTIPNIPSKTLSYFNVGIPVLASIDRSTDYGRVLDEAGAGLWSAAGDAEALKANFDRLYADADLRHRMGQGGRNYFLGHSTTCVAYTTIVSHVSPMD